MAAGNVSVSCSLDIGGIVTERQTEMKEYNFLATTKSVRVKARMSGMTGRLEVTSAMNHPAFLRSFVVENGYFKVAVGHNLELNSVRMNNFKSNIRRYLSQNLQQKLYSYYQAVLGHAFPRKSFFLL
ncbi:salivary anticoagulant protein P23-like [Rhipicephalus microplus]|uniref:salivary anticoagulant protein P23-like n=1 Tax=Rhipicephalus microplus TaxID=6941 RepID=UPI003F6D5579